MHRRTLLSGFGAGLLAGVVAPGGLRLARASPDARDGRALLVLFLRGGCDGLNLVVPYGEDAYHTLRPTLRIPPPGAGGALDLDGFFGLHPALGPLYDLYQQGAVALLPAVRPPDGGLSHFATQAAMEAAGGGDGSGWLGRYLATTPADTAALALGIAPPRALGGPRPVAAYRDPFDLRLGGSAAIDARLEQVVRTAYLEGAGGGAWQSAARVLLADRARNRSSVPAGVAYPEDGFGADLAAAARLFLTDPDMAVVTLNLAGWDTHRDQGGSSGQQAGRLDLLARGLAAFLAHLGPRAAEVAVLVQTEFGRTVAENASAGTDHGHATTWMVLGGGVRGGLYLGTGWPGLAEEQLERGRYLTGTVDYRQVYADLLARHLGTPDLAALLPDYTPPAAGASLFIR